MYAKDQNSSVYVTFYLLIFFVVFELNWVYLLWGFYSRVTNRKAFLCLLKHCNHICVYDLFN